MAMYVNADPGLEIAVRYDAPDEEWGQKVDFVDLVDDDYPLKPATWSDERQCLVTLNYGFDGRSTGDYLHLTDEQNANKHDGNGYYVAGTFYARSEQDCSVILAEAVELNEGENGAGTYVIGTPIWNAEELIHTDGGSGAECAIRIGFRVTHINAETGDAEGGSEFFIYEPNCDTHIGDAEGFVTTTSIDGTEQLTNDEHMIIQGSSSWTEAYPVQRKVTIRDLGEFRQNRALFTLLAGEKVKIELYVWLEGQDIDCINKIVEAQILANLQFHVDYGGQSGLVDIPDED